MKKIILIIVIVIILTITTQIGGIVLLISLLIFKKLHIENRGAKWILFTLFYLTSTLLIVPSIAKLFGREQIKNNNKVQPTNYFLTVLMNRNYVKKDMNEVLESISTRMNENNIKIKYLDANFPFLDGFPLLPHLSHNDGKKMDLSFVYNDSNGNASNKKKTISGYGDFEKINPTELNQTAFCKSNGYWQYDFPKYLTLGKINPNLTLSEKETKKLIEALISNNKVSKIFIEPNLKNRLQIKFDKVRFHGCGAVRHDDHIHFQIK